MLEMALVENLQREDISAMEAARAYQRMMQEFGLTQEAVGQRAGKSRASVANTLRLLNLPEEVQESIERGEITEGHGRALLMAERPEAILQVWRTVVRRGLSVREAERLAKEARETAPIRSARVESPTPAAGDGLQRSPEWTPISAAQDPNVAQIVDGLQQALQTRVTLRQFGSGAGKIEIEFYSASELERLVELLLGRGPHA
jgi:ParB family chromosome partitioning protein